MNDLVYVYTQKKKKQLLKINLSTCQLKIKSRKKIAFSFLIFLFQKKTKENGFTHLTITMIYANGIFRIFSIIIKDVLHIETFSH